MAAVIITTRLDDLERDPDIFQFHDEMEALVKKLRALKRADGSNDAEMAAAIIATSKRLAPRFH